MSEEIDRINLAQAMQETVNDGQTVIPREVDLALYQAAGKPEVLDRLRRADPWAGDLSI